jgi:hypothetical protein
LRVLSFQLSGVAWVPWRIGRCLAAVESRVEFIPAGPAGGNLESYGLPALERRAPLSQLLGELVPDVVHLHHDCAAQGLIGEVRRVLPSARILVTIHGEPDRSRRKLGRVVPDAYHVVAPDLLKLDGLARAPLARWIPNHPGRDPDPWDLVSSSPRSGLWRPASHVASFKDWGWLDQQVHALEVSGIPVQREPAILPHEQVRLRLRGACAAWIHRRGYLDLLTMEAMQEGALPVTLVDELDLDLWQHEIGFRPRFVAPLDSHLDKAVREAAATTAAEQNHRGMSTCWTAAACGRRWDSLYREVATVSR